MFSLLLLAAIARQEPTVPPIKVSPPPERFEIGSPLPSLPGVMVDTYNDGMGLAQQWARARHLQARILWIDGTANLDRVNSDDKIRGLMDRIADSGFNTVVFDIKPISGQVLYKSSIAPKITEWRGQHLPIEFDPVPSMVAEAHRNGLQIFVSLNAFSEGHSLFKVGPGYSQPEHQSVQYDAVPTLVAADGSVAEIAQTPNSSPEADSKIHVFTDRSKLRAPAEGLFGVSVASDGTVVDGFEGGGRGREVPTLPSQGAILVAQKEGAEFLRVHALPGSRVAVDSKANFVSSGERHDQYPLMMNPNDPNVQARALGIIGEVLTKYPVDGLLYDDRLRYAGMNADFSAESMQQFETYLNREMKWPDDVFKFTYTLGLRRGIRPGPFYDSWMVWRAQQMRNWVAKVRNEVKKKRPSSIFGVYGGSWYGDYPALGSNFAGPDLEAGFWFLTPQYAKTGYASLIDVLITGCYYRTATIYDAMVAGVPIGPTVESAGQLSNRIADDQCWTYAGLQLSDFKDNPEGLERVMQAACASTQGVMIFDLSHDIEPMWTVFKRAFQQRARAPHAEPGLLAKVRSMRSRYRGLGFRERPVVISPGSSGAGF